MDYKDFTQVHPVRTRAGSVRRGLLAVPRSIGTLLKIALRSILNSLRWVGRQLAGVGRAAKHGDSRTRLTFLIMGAGSLLRGQWGRGLLYLLVQVGYFAYMLLFGWGYVSELGTLGTATQQKVFDEAEGIYIYTQGDNSMQILLFGVLSVVLTLVYVYLYFHSLRAAYRAQRRVTEGKPLETFREDLHALKDRRYHISLLTPPILLVVTFTLLPLLFMVLIAFTNFDKTHQPPGNLFTWVGLD
ncbi:MAG: sugar ABC transporter permease, partial [Clostridia bacterium]|nr:sugar ABC transporter permease [Clostridia bacterium]